MFQEFGDEGGVKVSEVGGQVRVASEEVQDPIAYQLVVAAVVFNFCRTDQSPFDSFYALFYNFSALLHQFHLVFLQVSDFSFDSLLLVLGVTGGVGLGCRSFAIGANPFNEGAGVLFVSEEERVLEFVD